MVAPEAACRNLERLAAEGQQGAYGLYEAIDYTPSRLPPGATSVTVRQFMAHHEGMSLLSLAYVLLDRPMQRRFLKPIPMLRAADLLLQERVPKALRTGLPARRAKPAPRASLRPKRTGTHAGLHRSQRRGAGGPSALQRPVPRGCHQRRRRLQPLARPGRDALARRRHARLLGNVLLSARSGQRHALVQRLAADAQARQDGTRRSSPRPGPSSAARDDQIDTHTEISVSPEDDIELRRITITNRSESPRTIEVTSYAEVVLAPQAHDLAHPAFSNLFVQTELVRNRQAIFCTRRPRSAEERPPWMMHLMTVQGTTIGEASFETDRMRFIGRGRTLASPAAMDGKAPLSNSRVRCSIRWSASASVVRLQPNETVRIDLVTGVAESREAVDGADGEVPRSPPGGPGLRAGLDAQPHPAAATQRHRGRCPGVRPAGRLDHLRLGAAPGEGQRV